MSNDDDTPSLRDMSVAAGWLQDNLGVREPEARHIESLAWLIAKARAKEREPLAHLRAVILSLDSEDVGITKAVESVQRMIVDSVTVPAQTGGKE